MTKASDNAFPSVLLTEGGPPTAPAAGKQRMWSNASNLNMITAAGVQRVIGAAAVGVTWTLDVDESGASFTNWTNVAGTFASNGTVIQMTTVAASWRIAKFTALVPFGFGVIAEAEIRFPTSGQGTGGLVHGGIAIGSLGVILNQAGALHLQNFAAADIRTDVAITINLDTWYKLRAVVSGSWVSVYLDEVLKCTGVIASAVIGDFFQIGSYNSKVDYRNLKVWTARGGAPA